MSGQLSKFRYPPASRMSVMAELLNDLIAELARYHLLDKPNRDLSSAGQLRFGAKTPHAASFEGNSVKVDAMRQADLQALLREEIEARMDQHALGVLREAEVSERQLLRSLAIRGAS